jgi:uncharacterized membrane protein
MSDLIVAAYRSMTAAFAAGEQLAAMQQAVGTAAEDIVVVSRDASGRVTINQLIDLATGAPLAGGRWGMLIGMMFLGIGDRETGAGGLVAQFRATGLDDRFLQDVLHSLDKGGGAVGLRVRLLGRDRVVERLEGLKGKPKILWTRLSPETEDALSDLQNRIPESALSQVNANGRT